MQGAVERHHRVTSHYTSAVDEAVATIESPFDTASAHGSRCAVCFRVAV